MQLEFELAVFEATVHHVSILASVTNLEYEWVAK